MVRRLVGFHEYGHALDHLDRLTSMCGEEDIVAIDQILAARREFDLFVTMPEGFRKSDSNSEMQDRQESHRNGLAWVIALARVEFGAMATGFTAHPDPFEWVHPESIAYAATLQLLLEGVGGHFQALQDHKKLDDRLNKIYDDDRVKVALAKSRRVRIARIMLNALGKAGPSMYTDQQGEELTLVQNELDRQQTELRRTIRVFLMAMTSMDFSASRTTSEFVHRMQ